eukprot:TRINITY_DN19865_c0_g1_i2.p1 TRINITY_DN19865_c0_g1~~TRINITY_DN19865_c0_g1_i2.p1  ORF type:complete len:419 (+),score=37.46 TRINITY_DN19865_c0_g1_i2:37-1293(+)
MKWGWLVEASQDLIQILIAADGIEALHSDEGLMCAINRYSVWMAILERVTSGSDPVIPDIAPPDDVLFIWIVHKLAPLKYSADCIKFHNRILDIPRSEVSLDIRQQNCKAFWPQEWPWGLVESLPLDLDGVVKYDYDLAASAKKQMSFCYQITRPQYFNYGFLEKAVLRYKNFLQLIATREQSETTVPTYDIDLLWHTHMTDVFSYRDYCIDLVGSVINHDDGSSSDLDSILLQKYKETALAYTSLFKAPYAVRGSEKMSESKPDDWRYETSLGALLCDSMTDICVERIVQGRCEHPWTPVGVSLSVCNSVGEVVDDVFSCSVCYFIGVWEQQAETHTARVRSPTFIPLNRSGIRSSLLISGSKGSSLVELQPFLSEPFTKVTAWFPYCIDEVGTRASLCLEISAVATTSASLQLTTS